MSADDTIPVPKARLREIKREVDTLQEERDLLAEELRRLREEHEELREHLTGSIREVVRLREALAQAQGAAPAAPPPPAAVAAAPALTTPTAAPAPFMSPPVDAGALSDIGEAFVAWCRRGGPLLGRPEVFERFLQRTVPATTVLVVARDGAAARATFAADGDGPAYWLVRLSGAPALLPQPHGADGFAELAPAFEGGAADPRHVESVVPAVLRDEGGRYALATPGRVA